MMRAGNHFFWHMGNELLVESKLVGDTYQITATQPLHYAKLNVIDHAKTNQRRAP